MLNSVEEHLLLLAVLLFARLYDKLLERYYV